MMWVALIFFGVAAALLAGIESALIGVSRVRVRHAADEGDRLAARLAKSLERRQELLRAAMTAHHLCSVITFVVAALLFQKLLGRWGILAATVIGVPFFIIGLELAPKAMFRLFPFRTLRRLNFLLAVLHATTVPWRIFSRRRSANPSETPETANHEGVRQLSEHIILLKLLPENAAALLGNYAKFAALTARDVALPLESVSALPAGLPLVAAMQIAGQKSMRHHPVLDEQGEVIGFVDAAVLPPHPPADRFVRQFTQPAPHVSPGDSTLHCLQTLRKATAPLAVVSNGSPHVSALVLLEALLARLMNISDRPKVAAKKS
ncbi:MAG TPA: CNNM domain-containing protein [Verrucomicrobiaceae bacterium]|jgi:CBS domain containing-hemolysin-like protein